MCCDYYYVHSLPLKQLAAGDRRDERDLVPVLQDRVGVDADVLLVDGQRQFQGVLAQQLEPRRDGLPQRRRLRALGQLGLPLVDAGGRFRGREEDDLDFYGVAGHLYGCALRRLHKRLVEIGRCTSA